MNLIYICIKQDLGMKNVVWNFMWCVCSGVLSNEGQAVSSPRFSLNGEHLVWLQRPSGGPHNGAHKLMCCKWNSKQVCALVPYILEQVVFYLDISVSVLFTVGCCTEPYTFLGDLRNWLFIFTVHFCPNTLIHHLQSNEHQQLYIHNNRCITILFSCLSIANCYESIKMKFHASLTHSLPLTCSLLGVFLLVKLDCNGTKTTWEEVRE